MSRYTFLKEPNNEVVLTHDGILYRYQSTDAPTYLVAAGNSVFLKILFNNYEIKRTDEVFINGSLFMGTTMELVDKLKENIFPTTAVINDIIVEKQVVPNGGGVFYLDLSEYLDNYLIKNIFFTSNEVGKYFEMGRVILDESFTTYSNWEAMVVIGSSELNKSYFLNMNNFKIPITPQYIGGYSEFTDLSISLTLTSKKSGYDPVVIDFIDSIKVFDKIESPYLRAGDYAGTSSKNKIVANYRGAYSSIGLVLDNKGDYPDSGGGDSQGTIEYIYVNSPSLGYPGIFSFSCYTITLPFVINSYSDLIFSTQDAAHKARVNIGGTYVAEFSLTKTSILNKLNLANVPVYADNAAATSAGLLVGDVYRTSTGVLMIKF